MVLKDGYSASNGGRPGQLLRFNDRFAFIIGIDLGGTTVRTAITTLEGEELARIREDTERTSLQGLLNQVIGLITRLTALAGVSPEELLTVRLGTPGVVDPTTGLLRYIPNLPALEETDLLSRLRSQLHCPVEILNDVNVAALGEAWAGAGRTLSSFAYVSIGTGLGVGLISDGEVITGSSGRAGELGYLRPRFDDPLDAESRLSGPAIARRHRELGGSGRSQDAFAEAEAGIGPGARVIDELLPLLAWFCSSIALLLDPQAIILGGSVGLRLGEHLEAIEHHLRSRSPIVPELKVTELNDDAGLRGAVFTGIAASHQLLQERLRR